MNEFPKYLWLVDSNIYVYRAWFVRKNMQYDYLGNEINAVRGFLRFVYELITKEQPEQIAFAFDSRLSTSFRHQIYPEYKAQRPATPANLGLQFQYCREFLSALGLLNYSSNQYEADDVIGTWAKQAQLRGQTCQIISGDKDLAQLVRDNDCWWDYGRREALNSGKVKKHFGVWPKQIPDQLALAGDEADNIQGVQGIGASTAAKLLRRFESIDNLLANIPDISKMQLRNAKLLQDMVQANQALIRRNRKITGILRYIDDVPTQFERQAKDLEKLKQLCEQLGLNEQQFELWAKL